MTKKSRTFGCNKDVKKLIDVAVANKWKVDMTGGQHIKFTPPVKTQPIIIHSLTTSDWRSFADLKSRLRRSGLNV